MITLIPLSIVILFVILVILLAHANVTATSANIGTGQADELRALRRRVKTLEKIVVDQDNQLRRDIDGL